MQKAQKGTAPQGSVRERKRKAQVVGERKRKDISSGIDEIWCADLVVMRNLLVRRTRVIGISSSSL